MKIAHLAVLAQPVAVAADLHDMTVMQDAIDEDGGHQLAVDHPCAPRSFRSASSERGVRRGALASGAIGTRRPLTRDQGVRACKGTDDGELAEETCDSIVRKLLA